MKLINLNTPIYNSYNRSSKLISHSTTAMMEFSSNSKTSHLDRPKYPLYATRGTRTRAIYSWKAPPPSSEREIKWKPQIQMGKGNKDNYQGICTIRISRSTKIRQMSKSKMRRWKWWEWTSSTSNYENYL